MNRVSPLSRRMRHGVTTCWLALVMCGGLMGPRALATERVSPRIRLDPATATPVTSRGEYAGTVVITAAQAGMLDSVVVGGAGWRETRVDLPMPRSMAAGEVLTLPFRTLVDDPHQPLEIRAQFDGVWTRKHLDLSPERFARMGQDHPAMRRDDMSSVPPQGPAPAGNAGAGPRTCSDQEIRFRGRIVYERAANPGMDNSTPPDGDFDDPGDVPPTPAVVVGVDRILFEVMDDDIIDETIYSGYTDENGYFDVTVCWDDCDISGCDDPDIYLRFECDTDVVNVQDGYDILEPDYSWSTEDTQYFPDYTGHDIDFGVVQSADPGLNPALHIHNTITRAHRFILEHDGDYLPSVDVQWPEDNTEYNSFFEEIYVQTSEEWNEGTQTHEWGHHLLHHWTNPVDSDYCNGFCDAANANPCNMNEPCDGNGGHCVWCNETDHDAWNEGFPNWLGSAALRRWQARYGIAPWTRFTTSAADGRYTLETVRPCCSNPPATLHDPWTTEGFVGAMLRDIEDPAPENPAGPPWVCPQDSLAMTPRDILQVVREVQPIRIIEFLQAFWVRHPERAHDIRNTALAVAPVYGNLWPTPPIEIYQTPFCGTVQVGQPLTLHVETNGSTWSLKMRWYRDNVALSDTATRTGSFTDTLTITSATAGDAGRYKLAIQSCDGTQSLTSADFPVFVFGDFDAGHKVTGWGRNAFGSLGRGSYDPSTDSNPGDVVNLTNAVDVSAGYWNAVALLADGTVRSWGAAYLGNGTSDSSAIPVAVSGLNNIVAVSAGGYATCMALDADGYVWTWGDNYYGQVGDGIPGARLTPIQIPGLECVVSISMGGYTAAAVQADGSVWTWGYNGYGELGLGSFGGWYPTPELVPNIHDAVEVECGWSHTLVRRADGTVWASGSNAQGQLGDGTFTSRASFGPVLGLTDVISVRAGALHSLAVRSDKTPWAWGFNGNGNLGTIDLTGNLPTPVRPSAPATVRALDAGYNNSLFVDEEGTIWTCGYWGYGSLGHSGNAYAPQPVSATVGAAVRASAGIDFMLVIAPGARLTAPAVDQIAPGCSTAKLRVAAVGQPPLNYRWRKLNGANFIALNDGGRISGAQTPELTLTATEPNDTNLYDVVVWNDTNLTATVPVMLVTPPLWQTFDPGSNPNAWWRNERGGWTLTAGGYAATAPSATPATYNSFRLPLSDFSVEFDVANASLAGFTTNSGVWLRSQLTGPQPSGVLFALGDLYPWATGDAYWMRWNGFSWQAPQGVVPDVYSEGETVHVRIDVRGDTYSAYLNGAPDPTTQLVTPDYPSGSIGLFDNAGPAVFDNVFIQTLPSCAPGSGLMSASVVQYPQSQTVASGAPVTLSVVTTGSGPLTYQWLHNGRCIAGANTDVFAFTASNATAGRYECTVTNACGSVGSFPAIVSVDGSVQPGDINLDGHVDLTDLAMLQAAFGRCTADPGWLPAADLDNSGCIDAADAEVLATHLGG